MNTKYVLYSIILIGTILPPVALSVTTDDIISGLEKREQNIKSISGKFNLWSQILMNDGNTVEFEKHYEWIKDGNMQKLTEEYKTVPEKFKQKEPYKNCASCPNTMKVRMMTEKEVKAFDGQFTKQLFPDSNRGSIYPGSQFFSSGKMPADWLLLRMKEKPLSAFLKQEQKLKYANDVNLEGQICHLLEFNSPGINGKLYITEEREGFVPVKHENYIINSTLPFNTRGENIFSDFKHYGIITLPSKVIVSVYRVYPDKEQLATLEIFTVEQLELNTQIPESDLSLQFPIGTRVHDIVNNKDYIVP